MYLDYWSDEGTWKCSTSGTAYWALWRNNVNLIRAVWRIGNFPTASVGSTRVGALQVAVNVELDSCHTNVVTRIGTQRDVGFPRHDGAGSRIRDRYLRRHVVGGACKLNAIH